MALGQFKINFVQMESTVGQAKQQAQSISDLLDAMKKTIDSQRESWTGVAADQFQDAYNYCHQQAEALPVALDAAAGTLNTINGGTGDAESRIAASFVTH
ncbi:WXG100 family type VII secretion target [Amycolatopsis sp. NPDC004368]